MNLFQHGLAILSYAAMLQWIGAVFGLTPPSGPRMRRHTIAWARIALALVAIGALAATVGCASPTEPTCYQTAMPMVDVAGDTVSTVTTNWCVHTTYMP